MSNGFERGRGNDGARHGAAAMLFGRTPRGGHDAVAEALALAHLARQLADAPQAVLRDVAEVARDLCGADAVVVAVREDGQTGGSGVRWQAVSGKLAGQQDARWPVDACPCGASILADSSLLFDDPSEDFASMRATGIPLGEALGVPWHVQGRAAGALAAFLPDGQPQGFDADDLRLLESCAAFAAAAQQLCGARDGAADLEREVEEHRAAEQALREHQALVDATLSIATVGVLYFDARGHVTDVNSAFERMCGYGADELRALRSWRDLTPPEFHEISQRAIRDLAERGVTPPYTKQLVHKNGQRWWGLFAPARIAGSGEQSSCVMFVLDVTEQKATEARLAESERRYRALFDAMDEGFLLASVRFDEAGVPAGLHYVEANRAAARVLGMKKKQVSGRDCQPSLAVPPDHEPCWLTACAQVVRTGTSLRSQCVAPAHASWFDYCVYPVAGTGGTQVAILFHDVTQRIRAEDALRGSEARFRALADAAPALVYQFDVDGNVIYLNQRCLGRETVPALDASASDGWQVLARPDDMDGYLHGVYIGIRDHVYEQRAHAPVRGGAWHWFESHASPWYSGDGVHRGYVGITLDITAAVHAEEALKEADRRKDEFLATLAHELRNPLAPIANAVHLMRRPDGRRQSDRMVEMVGRQVRQIVRLVDDLMEVSRIARGKVGLKLERVPFAEIVHGAVESCQPAADRAGHQLSVSLPEAPIVLHADRVRLTQVFTNLLNNAVKYTDPGGRIWLDARRDGDIVVTTVRDTGIGIPADALPRVFDMFAQAHRSAGRGQGGLGIGLTMVRSLVELHHGSVEARSAGPGQGSEFTVRLPVAAEGDVPAAAPEAGHGAAPLQGRRVLVVDDNRDAADTLALLLEADGAEVRVAYDGRTALSAAESFQPHNVLLDIGMPGMDGYEVARRLRLDPRLAGTRIIALTGWAQDADRRQTRNRGFSHHLTKPVCSEDLQRVLCET